ncbi:MAG: thioredoxin domain-containing protein [Lachnospiraceae bacterium]|nr:thioredoxin domain-containing protein [Lachnospiraceae bacterium]
MAEKIGKKEFEQRVLKSQAPVVVDFYSDSCIACKKLSPALSQAEELLGKKCAFYKVNTNFEEELTEEYEIMSRPTLIVYRSGREAGRKTGVQKPEELIQWLEAFMEE